MVAITILFLVLLVLIAAGLGVALMEVRARRRELSRRTDLVAHTARTRAHVPHGLAPHLTTVGAWFRRLFAFGLPYRWGMRAPPVTLILSGVGGAAFAWFFLGGLFHLPFWITLPLTVAAFVLIPRQVLKIQQNRAEQNFLNLFPDALDMVVRMVRAGLPVMAAIRTVGNEAPPPVNAVFGSLADQVDIGILFDEALLQTGERIGLADFRFFAVAVSLQHATGGNIAATLEILAEIIRKRRGARLRAKSTTSEVRLSAMVLSALPFVVLAGLLLFSPGYLAPLITDPRGNVIVGLAILGLTMGFLTMRQLMRRATQL